MDDVKIGETVYSVGNEAGLERSLGEGIVSGLRQWEGVRIIQNSAPTQHGSSGGGLFDSRGNLVVDHDSDQRHRSEYELLDRRGGVLAVAPSLGSAGPK